MGIYNMCGCVSMLDWLWMPDEIYWDIKLLIAEIAWGIDIVNTTDAHWDSAMRKVPRRHIFWEWGTSALTWACTHGHVAIVQWAYRRHSLAPAWKCNVFGVDQWLSQGKCSQSLAANHALATASRHGHVNVCQFLHDEGATDVNNALERACDRGQLVVAKWARAQGATDWTMSYCLAQYPARRPIDGRRRGTTAIERWLRAELRKDIAGPIYLSTRISL